MKVCDFHCKSVRLSGLILLGGLGLSGCAPIPQAYPSAPQQQWTNNVPQAAPLLPNRQRPAAVQRYAASPEQQRPQRSAQKAQQTTVPPTLQPAQQQARQAAAAKKAATRQAQQRQQSRRTPVSTYRPQAVRRAPPSVAPVEKRVAPPPAKKPVARARPVQPQVQPRQQQPVTTIQKKAPEVEVLDMSSTAKQPASKPVAEKVVPPLPSYQNNPAVVILTKQANNQLVAGKKDQAASTLERALRIAPENPMLWLRLAEVNEQQGNKTQAASMAKKAIGLAPNDAKIKQRGIRLIN